MRWGALVAVAVGAALLQCTLVQALFFWTSAGWVGPELLAALTVLLALYARNGTEAALGGWVLGMAVEWTITGPGTGLLALLYAGGAAVVFRGADLFFRDRPLTQMAMAAAFCLGAYGLWSVYDAVVGAAAGGLGRRLLAVGGLALYTAVLTPPLALATGPLRRWLAGSGGLRR